MEESIKILSMKNKIIKIVVAILVLLSLIESCQPKNVSASCVLMDLGLGGTPLEYKSIPIKSHGFKSYTRYTAITRKTSLQYKLQKEYAYTGQYGIRQVNGRFCIAVGTGVTDKMGQYVDVVLENGTIIHCIVCDQKADQHTKEDRITTAHNKCVCEFYLDTVLPEIKECGDVSKACEAWQSPVCEFRVFDINIFDPIKPKSCIQSKEFMQEISLL